MLTKQQARELERAHRLGLFFGKDENKTIVGTYRPFAAEVALFTDNVAGADAAASGKEVKPSIADEKMALKHEIASDLSEVCLSTKAYAMKKGDLTLAAAMNLPETTIFEKKDEDIQPFFTAQNELITPLLDVPGYADYEVTEALMTAIEEKVARFHAMIGVSGVNQTDYSTANKEVDVWLTAIESNLAQFELLLPRLVKKYPLFADGYHQNARLGDRDIRHSGIDGLITKKSTGVPVPDAVVSLEKTNKVAVSTITGAYRLVEVNPGFYNVVVKVNGEEVVRLLYQIERGKVKKLDFEI